MSLNPEDFMGGPIVITEEMMPSTSKAQAKLMNIAAHTPGGYGGVPEKVGKDFHAADKAAGKYKKGGSVVYEKTPGSGLARRGNRHVKA